jgi:hypothetical protein
VSDAVTVSVSSTDESGVADAQAAGATEVVAAGARAGIDIGISKGKGKSADKATVGADSIEDVDGDLDTSLKSMLNHPLRLRDDSQVSQPVN